MRFHRERMAPGEMEKIILPKAKLAGLTGELTLSVEEETL